MTVIKNLAVSGSLDLVYIPENHRMKYGLFQKQKLIPPMGTNSKKHSMIGLQTKELQTGLLIGIMYQLISNPFNHRVLKTFSMGLN